MKTALVLSGGGMFGAWQAGAWSVLAPNFKPDLIVGASVGALNGYAIAGGATPDELIAFWHQPSLALRNLPATIQELMRRHPPRQEYAVVLTDLLRMKPKVFAGPGITWRHLAASCAIPGVLPQRRIHGRWYTDGGLLNPLRNPHRRAACAAGDPGGGSEAIRQDFPRDARAPPAGSLGSGSDDH
jgi:NTE family protein